MVVKENLLCRLKRRVSWQCRRSIVMQKRPDMISLEPVAYQKLRKLTDVWELHEHLHLTSIDNCFLIHSHFHEGGLAGNGFFTSKVSIRMNPTAVLRFT
jgi:hypothetical protein